MIQENNGWDAICQNFVSLFFNFKTFPALNPLINPPWRIVSNYCKWVNRLHMTMNNVNVGGDIKRTIIFCGVIVIIQYQSKLNKDADLWDD